MLQAKAWCNPQSIVNYPKVSELGGVVQTIYMNDGYQLLFERSCRGQQKLENHQLIHQKIEERKKSNDLKNLTKWDTFREERAKYAEKALTILKDRVRIRKLITIMKLTTVFPHCISNIKVWRERSKRRVMNLFLAIRFKVRF